MHMKKTFRLLSLAMLVLMLRYTLLPHQFMAYASGEQLVTSNGLSLEASKKHQEMERVYISEHPEQYLLNRFVMGDYLRDNALTPVQLGVADPLLRPWATETLSYRDPPWPTTLSVHIRSTHLLI